MLPALLLIGAGIKTAERLPSFDRNVSPANNGYSHKLIPNLPWQTVDKSLNCKLGEKNGFINRFVIINLAPDLFEPKTVTDIAQTVESYIAKYVFPNWRMTANIEIFTPVQDPIVIDFGTSLDPHIAKGTYIPIYLVDDFNTAVGNNFAVAMHGNVSGSVMNGPDALTFLPPAPPSSPAYPNPSVDIPTLYTAIPYGTPFIIIPAGTNGTGNGINAAVARNQANPNLGPTDFYQAFALSLSQQVIQTMINPTGALYNGAGDPVGIASQTYDQLFLICEATAPFSQGNDNIFWYRNWPMTNFAFPAYFFPYNTSGQYDFLNKAAAPFTPYKGTQFFLYQQALVPGGSVVTDLEAGAYVSDPADPSNIEFVLNGSIYSYTGWGLRSVESKDGSKKLYGANHSIHPLRDQPDLHAAKQVTRKIDAKCKRVCCNQAANKDAKTQPHLLPFQYLDEDGVIVTRFKFINYVPDIISHVEMAALTQESVNFVNTRFYPYWNRKAEAEVVTYPNLPNFDGSFIAMYVSRVSMANLNTPWGLSTLSGAADNLNNVPNALAGPLLTEYLVSTTEYIVPPLPLGNPYLIFNVVDLANSGGAPYDVLLNLYTVVASHEMEELIIDPTYAYYFATSNPPEDGAILFSQFEMADPDELSIVSQTGVPGTYVMNPTVTPAYFDAYLQNSLYDTTGFGYRALVPPNPRQQIVWQQQGQPLQVGWTINDFDKTGNLTLWNAGNIFDANTYLYAFTFTPITSTPLAPIYARLQTPAPLY